MEIFVFEIFVAREWLNDGISLIESFGKLGNIFKKGDVCNVTFF